MYLPLVITPRFRSRELGKDESPHGGTVGLALQIASRYD